MRMAAERWIYIVKGDVGGRGRAEREERVIVRGEGDLCLVTGVRVGGGRAAVAGDTLVGAERLGPLRLG